MDDMNWKQFIKEKRNKLCDNYCNYCKDNDECSEEAFRLLNVIKQFDDYVAMFEEGGIFYTK